MKKSHAHNELSDDVCIGKGCSKAIKVRMANKGRTLCYTCFCKKEAGRGHTINTQPRKKRIVKGLPVKDFNKNSD